MTEEPEVYKALVSGFIQACINLKIVTGINIESLFNMKDNVDWYSMEDWKKMLETVINTYDNPGPIVERVGIEMMLSWYNNGPGKDIIKCGVDFLHFQTSSDGYYSVVKGPPEVIGEFKLVDIDEENGTATVYSTTLFDKDMERGVLIGGMKAPGDLNYIDVVNSKNRAVFKIKFH